MVWHPDKRLVVFVEYKAFFLELRTEGLYGAAHRLQILEGDVLVQVRHPPETSGFHPVVEDYS